MNVTVDLKYCMYKNVILNTSLFCQNYCFDKSSTPGSFLYHAQVNVLPEMLSTFKTINDINEN